MILIVLLYAFLAISFTLGKMLLDFLPPLFFIAVRMMVAGSLLLGASYFFSTSHKRFTRKDFLNLIGLASIHIMLPYTTEFVGLQSMSSCHAALLFNLSPFFAALFSYIVFNERMTMKKWLGFLLGIGSIMFFFVMHDGVCVSLHLQMAYLLVLFSVICGALGWVVFRTFVQQGYNPLDLNGFAMLIAGVQSLGLSYFFHEQVHFPWDQWMMFGLLFFGIIICANFIYYNFYGYLLKFYTATMLSFVGCLTPLITAVFDWLFLGLWVQPIFFIVLAVMVLGIYLFYQEELKQGYIKRGSN